MLQTTHFSVLFLQLHGLHIYEIKITTTYQQSSFRFLLLTNYDAKFVKKVFKQWNQSTRQIKVVSFNDTFALKHMPNQGRKLECLIYLCHVAMHSSFYDIL